MSIAVLLVAAAHGIPVIIARAASGKGGALIAAIIMSIFAFATGGSQYTVIDLIAIWACFFLL